MFLLCFSKYRDGYICRYAESAVFLKDICEGIAGQAAEAGVAHQSLHQWLLERLFGKSPQLLQLERSLAADVGSFPAKETFLFQDIFSRLHLLSQNGTSKASTW